MAKKGRRVVDLKQQQKAAEAKKLRRQFGGAFGKANPELHHFLTTGTPQQDEARERYKAKVQEEGAQARQRLQDMAEHSSADFGEYMAQQRYLDALNAKLDESW